MSKKFILGFKDRMTQIFDENGFAVPVTVINFEKNIISDLKTEERDGYQAVVVVVGEQKKQRMTKAVLGQRGGAFRIAKEFRVDSLDDFEKGAEINLDILAEGDNVILSAVSKGKGFQGGVKR